MALVDYGVLIYKNGELITKDFILDDNIMIDGKKFSIHPKACFIQYGEEMLMEFLNDVDKTPVKIETTIDNVFFKIRQRKAMVRIYIKSLKDEYVVFAGYGIDMNWKKFIKYYNYPKAIVRELKKLEKNKRKKGR